MNLSEFSRLGGKARAARLTPAQRKASASDAARATIAAIMGGSLNENDDTSARAMRGGY